MVRKIFFKEMHNCRGNRVGHLLPFRNFHNRPVCETCVPSNWFTLTGIVSYRGKPGMSGSLLFEHEGRLNGFWTPRTRIRRTLFRISALSQTRCFFRMNAPTFSSSTSLLYTIYAKCKITTSNHYDRERPFTPLSKKRTVAHGKIVIPPNPQTSWTFI